MGVELPEWERDLLIAQTRCGTHLRRLPPESHPAVAFVYSHDGRYSHPVCESTLNHWLDNADEDPSLEPSAIYWLDRTPGP